MASWERQQQEVADSYNEPLVMNSGFYDVDLTETLYEQKLANISGLLNFIREWCHGNSSCVEVLYRHFPERTQLPVDKHLFARLLDKIIESHNLQDAEALLVTKVYGAVGGLGVVLNLCLTYMMLYLPYRSATTVFLTILTLMDLYQSCELLTNLYIASIKHQNVIDRDQKWWRWFDQFRNLFWPASSVLLMLLVALDRCTVYNAPGGDLFRKHRKLKVASSLAVMVILVAACSYVLPATIDIRMNSKTVQVFVCITRWCRGSSLLHYERRSSNDSRMKLYQMFLQGNIFMICVAFLPLYVCILSAISKATSLEKEYASERSKLTQRGQEVVYFSDFHVPKFTPKRELPVIYEVDEENASIIERGIIFPYTLLIWHQATSLCPLIDKDSKFYDNKPIPENAPPVVVQNFVRRGFDSAVDKLHIFRPSKRRSLSRLAFRSKFPARRSSFDLNINALPSNSTGPKLVIRPDAFASQPAAAGVCPRCLHGQHIHHHRSTLSTKQIVFSINCCCNRTAPINCRTEIYLNSDNHDAASSSSVRRVKNSTSLRTIEENKTSFSYEQFIPAACKVDNMDLLSEAGISYAYSNCHSPQMMFQEDSRYEEQVTDRHCNYQHYGDWQHNPILASSATSCDASNQNRIPKMAPKLCEIIHQVSFRGKVECGGYISAGEVVPGQPARGHCEVCKKQMPLGECDNANCNNDFLTRVKQYLPGHKHKVKRDSGHSVTEVPLADPKCNRSQLIMLIIKEHYKMHSHKMEQIDIPESLKISITANKMERAKCIIYRLMFQTACYFALIFNHCLVEVAISPHSTLLYMGSYFKIFVHFISLLIFSHTFRLRLIKWLFQNK